MSSQFSTLLRRLRLRSGLTQEGLAERSKLGVRTVRGLETGERADPRMGTVLRLADALELPAADRVELFAAAGHATPPAREEPNQPDPEPAPAARDEPAPVDDRLADAAAQLAHQVRARWQREEELRQVHDPFPLPVRWQPVAEELTDSWAEIRRAPPGAAAAPLDLTGRLDEVVDVYRRIPSGRLVVLGRAGSGKTILTLRFVLELLRHRRAGDPVPVIFSVGSWHPATTRFRDWLTAQLERDHPGLAAPSPDGSTFAAALVETDRVLPVLDGFDEIAGGLHRAALRALNATTLPLVLTSRPDEYTSAVAGTDVLTAAGGVRLTDLTVADLTDYLPRTTRKSGSDGTAWQPVLSRVRDDPAGVLARSLTTPLMVGLARAIYSDTPDHDPAELVDPERFPTEAAVEEHLLGNFVPIVYRSEPESRRFDPERVPRWLGYLADHLTRLGTHDLAWWQLGTSMSRAGRMVVVALVVALGTAVVDLVVEGVLTVEINLFFFVFAAALGLVVGVSFGGAQDFATRGPGTTPQPSRVRVQFRGRAGKRRALVLHRVRVGFGLGFMLGFVYGFMRELLRSALLGLGNGMVVGSVDALVFGGVFGVSAGLVFGLVTVCEAPLDLRSVGSPMRLLRANRATVVGQMLVFGPVFAVFVTFGGWLTVSLLQQLPAGVRHGISFGWSPLFGLALGIVGGLCGGLGYALSLTAWGRWIVFARVWLPLTGRLPWAVPAFLEDAYRRGVLRRAGAVYQFRHARLQAHLTNAYRSS